MRKLINILATLSILSVLTITTLFVGAKDVNSLNEMETEIKLESVTMNNKKEGKNIVSDTNPETTTVEEITTEKDRLTETTTYKVYSIPEMTTSNKVEKPTSAKSPKITPVENTAKVTKSVSNKKVETTLTFDNQGNKKEITLIIQGNSYTKTTKTTFVVPKKFKKKTAIAEIVVEKGTYKNGKYTRNSIASRYVWWIPETSTSQEITTVPPTTVAITTIPEITTIIEETSYIEETVTVTEETCEVVFE